MQTVEMVRSETQGFDFGYWDRKGERFIRVLEEEQMAVMAEALGCDVALVESLQVLLDDLKLLIHSDLEDIWQRLERVERWVRSLESRYGD